jgi:hypothetical protein
MRRKNSGYVSYRRPYLRDYKTWYSCFLESRKYCGLISNNVNIFHLEIFTYLCQRSVLPSNELAVVLNLFQPRSAQTRVILPSARKGC